jgi:hypothetical protein
MESAVARSVKSELAELETCGWDLGREASEA